MAVLVPAHEIPEAVKEVCLSFYYDVAKVWRLDVPISDMYVTRLHRHFELPFLWAEGAKYCLTHASCSRTWKSIQTNMRG
jgi:hypothetical protein